MGVLYRKRCEHCDSSQDVTFDGFAGAVITDHGSPGEILAEGYLAYLRSDDDLVVLPHPIEDYALQEAGATWNSASANGRILRVTNLICLDCGAINSTARVHSGCLGCSIGLVAAGAMIAVNIWILDLHELIEIALIWVALAAPVFIADWYVQLRYGRNADRYKFRTCKKCGSVRARPLRSSKSRRFPCEKCGKKSVTITFAGKS